MSFGFLPPPISKSSRNCPRCGLNFAIAEVNCPHCHSLSERELEKLKGHIEQRHRVNSSLGLIFLLMALLIAITLLI